MTTFEVDAFVTARIARARSSTGSRVVSLTAAQRCSGSSIS
jgi:hypothetical protein